MGGRIIRVFEQSTCTLNRRTIFIRVQRLERNTSVEKDFTSFGVLQDTERQLTSEANRCVYTCACVLARSYSSTNVHCVLGL